MSDETIPVSLENRLKLAIENCGLSGDELARRAGVSNSSLSLFRRGKRGLTLETVEKLLRYFDMEVTGKKKAAASS